MCFRDYMHKLICILYHNIFKPTTWKSGLYNPDWVFHCRIPSSGFCLCLSYPADRYRKCCVRRERVTLLWQMAWQSVKCGGLCIHQSNVWGAPELKCHNRLSVKECLSQTSELLCLGHLYLPISPTASEAIRSHSSFVLRSTRHLAFLLAAHQSTDECVVCTVKYVFECAENFVPLLQLLTKTYFQDHWFD